MRVTFYRVLNLLVRVGLVVAAVKVAPKASEWFRQYSYARRMIRDERD